MDNIDKLPLVNIIIVDSGNSAKETILQCLVSVINQDYPNKKIFLVCDELPPEVVDVLEQPSLRALITPTNNINEILTSETSELTYLLQSNQCLNIDAISLSVKIILENMGFFGLVYSDYTLIQNNVACYIPQVSYDKERLMAQPTDLQGNFLVATKLFQDTKDTEFAANPIYFSLLKMSEFGIFKSIPLSLYTYNPLSHDKDKLNKLNLTRDQYFQGKSRA